MKTRLTLPAEDVAFIDEYAARAGAGSRSAAPQAAIGLLRAAELEAEYREAFGEWDGSGGAVLWDHATEDGLH